MSVEASGNPAAQGALRELTVQAHQGKLREFAINPTVGEEAVK